MFDHAVRVVDVAELPDAMALTQAVGRELERQVDGGSTVADRRVLLVLDGCEHLLPACAELVAVLLRRLPQLRVLTTSRQPLRVTGESVLPVPPLSYPDDSESADPLRLTSYDAVALFVERAAAAVPAFRLTEENAAAVAALCARLDGNPLAIELAAARVRVLAPEAIVERLDHRGRLLAKADPGVPGRLRSLRGSIDASYDLCTEPERRLWARMSVFPSSFDLAAAEAVCSGDGIEESDVLDLVDGLLEKSVLSRADVDGTQVRYRMPETLRAYGAERLGEDGLSLRRMRHLAWCEGLVHTGAEQGVGIRQAGWFPRSRRERAPLRAALGLAPAAPATAPVALRMATALECFWVLSGEVGEGRHWLTRALEHPTGTAAERVRALSLAASFAAVDS